MTYKNSRPHGFCQPSPADRVKAVRAFDGLNNHDLDALQGQSALPIDRADTMVDNGIGTSSLPLGIATNLLINGRDALIPMAVEEPSIVAAASHAAKLARAGGFQASTASLMIVRELAGQAVALGG